MSHDFTVTAPTRWEVRRAIRLGVPSDFRIAAQGTRRSDGAIATVYARDGREATGAAHARLIAAAPELLDVLRDLTNLAVLAFDVQTTADGLIAPHQIKAARALLARLEGVTA